MTFDDEIKSISNEILSKVRRKVEENKNDDDNYYKYAYLSTGDNVLSFNFEKKNICFNAQNLLNYHCEVLTIYEDDTRVWGYGIEYETSLERSMKQFPESSLFEERFKRQASFTDEERNLIKKFYIDLNNYIDCFEYNIEKTHSPQNFNDNLSYVYNTYMLNKELDKYDDLSNIVFPSVSAGVNWWAKAISTEASDDEPKIPDEKLEIFKQVLSKTIMEKMIDNGRYRLSIQSDYGPDQILRLALDASNIHYMNVPWKTYMYISLYKTTCEGQVLFDSTTSEDIDNAKEIYSRLYLNSTEKDNSLKRTKD